MKHPIHFRNSRGQMTIEAILLLMIMVSLFTIVHRTIKSKDYLNQIVSGPWSYIAGMIENGVWQPVEAGKKVHPNVFGRRASPEPL